jgi:hypothetical protein
MYKLINSRLRDGTIVQDCVLRLYDNACIPFDLANTDAQQFAKWLKDGGIPEAATEGEVVTPEWITETIAKLLPSA